MAVAELPAVEYAEQAAAFSLVGYEQRLAALLSATRSGLMSRQSYREHAAALMQQTLQRAKAQGLPVLEVSRALVFSTQRALQSAIQPYATPAAAAEDWAVASA